MIMPTTTEEEKINKARAQLEKAKADVDEAMRRSNTLIASIDAAEKAAELVNSQTQKKADAQLKAISDDLDTKVLQYLKNSAT